MISNYQHGNVQKCAQKQREANQIQQYLTMLDTSDTNNYCDITVISEAKHVVSNTATQHKLDGLQWQTANQYVSTGKVHFQKMSVSVTLTF